MKRSRRDQVEVEMRPSRDRGDRVEIGVVVCLTRVRVVNGHVKNK